MPHLAMVPMIFRAMRSILPLIALSFVFLGASFDAHAQRGERITDYTVALTVNKDRTVDIVETITINVEGNVFKRGLLRDIPVRYRGKLGETVYIDLDVKSIKRDGRTEPYHQSYEGRYVRLRIGNADVMLQHGLHTYEIRYSVSDSIGFFEKYDEIYWNAIGTEWPFGIDNAQVSILLPEGANIQQQAFYTGSQGAQSSDFEVVNRTESQVTVRSTRPFAAREGMTIAVAWQKGIVPAPSEAEKMAETAFDNSPLAILILALVTQLLWLYSAWKKVGRDPEGGAIIPRFHPPKDISPAIASYVSGLGSFAKSQEASFMAALVDLAIKGYLTIDSTGDDVAVVKSGKGDPNRLPAGQKALFAKLFASKKRRTFAKLPYKTMAGIMTAFSNAVDVETDQVYFRRNNGYMLPGFIIAILGLLGYCVASVIWSPPFNIPLLTLVAAGCATGVLAIVIGIIDFIKGKQTISSLFRLPFFVIIFFGTIFTVVAGDDVAAMLTLNWLHVPFIMAMVIALYLFSDWMKAPTKLGREVLDEVEGLRLFMTVTVAEQAEHVDMPDLTPQLYEDLLPYAIGLGVEKTWSKAFEEKVFSQLPPENAYRPRWYSGRFDTARPTATLAAMTSTLGTNLASAMTPPASSSSGSSGGGFSGGGGGGGGGGGW
nr:DUF2207 domain-containing protein [uncultured Cohaesibacter sp.]